MLPFEMDEEDRPSRSGGPRQDAASQLGSESLDSYSLDELGERIALLETEILRVKSHRDKSAAHRLAAEALFRPRGG